MAVTIDFIFDFGSPNAYLAHRAIPDIAERTGATFNYVPCLLGGIFKATNNVSPAISLQGVRNKPEYSAIETRRFLNRFGVAAYSPNPHFPVNTLMMMRGAVYMREHKLYASYVEAMYQCMWQKGRKMDEVEVFAIALEEYGLPKEEIVQGINDPSVKQRLLENTNDAVERGAFGSPTFFLGEEIFFGKETLRDIEELLTAAG